MKKDLPLSIRKDLSKIIINRNGDLINSYMQTINIIGYITNTCYYKLLVDNLIISNDNDILIDKPTQLLTKRILAHFLEINGICIKNNDKNTKANILGDMNILNLSETFINIPIIETSTENLNLFGVTLLKMGDLIKFDTPKLLPIIKMRIGKNYSKGYLLDKNFGGGAYLESHDTPHFHMPSNPNSNGYYILAIKKNSSYYLGAFKIPYNYAIYTPPWIYHCDAFLKGEYLVVYGITNNYTPRLLRHGAKNGIVDFRIN